MGIFAVLEKKSPTKKVLSHMDNNVENRIKLVFFWNSQGRKENYRFIGIM